MTRAYAETYLYDAQNNLGGMMDYAVRDCGYEPDAFFEYFLLSGVSEQFEKGNPKFIAGMSGPELAREVILRVYGKEMLISPSTDVDKGDIFWAGWALAFYQWRSGLTFSLLHKILPFTELLRLYTTLHEADVEKFAEVAESRVSAYMDDQETNLARLRKAAGYSQKGLADAAGVNKRAIQLYEQRQNDIGKAQAATLASLSRVIGCTIEDLLEYENRS